MKVDLANKEVPKSEADCDLIGLKDYTVVVMTESSLETELLVNNYCNKHKIKFICCDVNGVFTRVFCDFGKEFEVLDKNGEECNEMIIKNISNDPKGIVQLM